MVFPNSYSLFTDMSLSDVSGHDSVLNTTLVSTLSTYDSTGGTAVSDGEYITSLSAPDVSVLNNEIATNKSNYRNAITSLNQDFLDATDDNNTINNDDITSYIEKQEEIEELKELGEKGFKDGGDVSLTVIKIPDISESGVESLFKRR